MWLLSDYDYNVVITDVEVNNQMSQFNLLCAAFSGYVFSTHLISGVSCRVSSILME